MHTAIMAGFCIAGLNFLRVCVKALSLAEEERIYRVGEAESFRSTIIQSKLIQAIAAFLLSCYYLVNGISLDTWFLVGILAWIIVTQLIISMTICMPKPSFARSVYGAQCLILITLGTIQTLFICVQWARSEQILLLVFGFSLLAISAYLWSRSIAKILARFSETENQNYFDLS
jgi:uncharacterized membrane protein (GlpM family)